MFKRYISKQVTKLLWCSRATYCGGYWINLKEKIKKKTRIEVGLRDEKLENVKTFKHAFRYKLC